MYFVGPLIIIRKIVLYIKKDSVIGGKEVPMGAKGDSILKLMSLGVNTSDMLVLRSRGDVSSFLEYGVLHLYHMEGWEKISIRTDNKLGQVTYKKWGLPFYPNRTIEETREILTNELLDLVDVKIDILVSKGIDPQDSILSGKYLRSMEEDFLDYVLGPSTGRDIDKKIPKTWEASSGVMPTDLPVDKMKELLDIVLGVLHRNFQVPFVVEFSVYPYPIGMLNKNLIFWEVIEGK